MATETEIILEALDFERRHWQGVVESRRRLSKAVKQWAKETRLPQLEKTIADIQMRGLSK